LPHAALPHASAAAAGAGAGVAAAAVFLGIAAPQWLLPAGPQGRPFASCGLAGFTFLCVCCQIRLVN